jgi:hypothetical protein
MWMSAGRLPRRSLPALQVMRLMEINLQRIPDQIVHNIYRQVVNPLTLSPGLGKAIMTMTVTVVELSGLIPMSVPK